MFKLERENIQHQHFCFNVHEFHDLTRIQTQLNVETTWLNMKRDLSSLPKALRRCVSLFLFILFIFILLLLLCSVGITGKTFHLSRQLAWQPCEDQHRSLYHPWSVCFEKLCSVLSFLITIFIKISLYEPDWMAGVQNKAKPLIQFAW